MQIFNRGCGGAFTLCGITRAGRNKIAVLACPRNLMNSQTHICPTQTKMESPKSFAARVVFRLRRAGWIARAVLRGYLTGQPIEEARPRKGCC